jgi:hypothetical protein
LDSSLREYVVDIESVCEVRVNEGKLTSILTNTSKLIVLEERIEASRVDEDIRGVEDPECPRATAKITRTIREDGFRRKTGGAGFVRIEGVGVRLIVRVKASSPLKAIKIMQIISQGRLDP